MLPLKGTNQKDRDEQPGSMNLIAIKIKAYNVLYEADVYMIAIQLTVATLKGTTLYANVSILL